MAFDIVRIVRIQCLVVRSSWPSVVFVVIVFGVATCGLAMQCHIVLFVSVVVVVVMVIVIIICT